ncbi:hypothetical protein B296_00025140 [Ensete ventricosum]|uniref:Uncharacterized protein n=1 Tax=Ensete ventricosum TaxID=4639 RepID=A0A426YF69_ENSVE|nr:hypothetical protein B296_00025140 [Ensete ventricosum]
MARDKKSGTATSDPNAVMDGIGVSWMWRTESSLPLPSPPHRAACMRWKTINGPHGGWWQGKLLVVIVLGHASGTDPVGGVASGIMMVSTGTGLWIGDDSHWWQKGSGCRRRQSMTYGPCFA